MKKTWINIDREILEPQHREKIKHYIWVYIYTIYDENYTPEDIARNYDMPIGAVKNQLRELASMGYIEWKQDFYKYARREKIPEHIKWEVWERDNFTCQECGSRKYLSVDHNIPKFFGGSDKLDNLQTLCKSCNSKKGNR